VPIEY